VAATSHGVYATARVEPTARAVKRRWLGRTGLRSGALTGTQLGLLDQYAQCTAKVRLIDAYVGEHGLIRGDGSLQPVLALYTSLVNSARHALTRLEASLTEAQRPAHDPLADYIRENYGDDE
jgi:hypothetical protein